MSYRNYSIQETDLGPMLSGTRVSIYDVMLAHDAGQDLFHLCVNYNLSPVHVQIALEYIEEHSEQLTEDLKEILPKKAEREQHYRAIAAERRKIPVTMTPERVAFYALREKNRRLRGENGDKDHS
ncbi:MAG: hypothetical protein NT075_26045 [Chloroflexi bacterium]|nr:hypothetical protein [Chloroflexota bacterium]